MVPPSSDPRHSSRRRESSLWWVRDMIQNHVRKSSKRLAQHQMRVSHPFLDSYFLYSSVLGSHVFFLLFLPPVYLLLDPRFGRILILTLGSGVYMTAIVKDYFCIERPLSPPVRRLLIGSYHLEYGFPSTHSANAVGMSIIAYFLLLQIRKTISFLVDFNLIEPQSWTAFLSSPPFAELFILFYAFTVIYGRVYLGMHSVIDCVAGALLGAVSALGTLLFDKYLEQTLLWQSSFVPLTIFALGCLSLVVHPIPLEPCPCYDDVVSFVGAFIGVAMGNWRTNNYFYEDMDKLDMMLGGLERTLPPNVSWAMTTFWNYTALQSIRGRLVASMAFAIVPVLVWKVCASPILKKGFPVTYRICKSLIVRRPVNDASKLGEPCPSSHAKHLKHQQGNQSNPRTKSGCTLYYSSEERMCIGMCLLLTPDAPRLLLYTGIGYIGATFSRYLISYYDVKVFKLVV